MLVIRFCEKQFLIYFSIFGIGIVIGDLIEWGCFNLDNSISIIDALSLFVTVGLTIYIATILDKESKNKQFEVDLIVEQINEVENILKEIDSLISKYIMILFNKSNWIIQKKIF